MKTREDFINDANARIYKLINELALKGQPGLEVKTLINLELDQTHTRSDEWYEEAEVEQNPETAALYFKIAQAVLVRNGLADGLPYCPLCGKIGNPEHNGAPLIDAKVCEACNNRKVIPARIRAAQSPELEKQKETC